MSNFTLSEQATKSFNLPTMAMLTSSMEPTMGWMLSNLTAGSTIPATASIQTAYAPAVSLGPITFADLDDLQAVTGQVAWPHETQLVTPIPEPSTKLSVYDAVFANIAESVLTPFSGLISIHPTTQNVTYASAKGSHYICTFRDDRMLLFRQSILDADAIEVEHADELLGSLQLELDHIVRLFSGSPERGSANLDEETIKTCKGLIRILSSYLMKKETTNPRPFFVPSPDGTVLFKWLRSERELSVTIEQSILQVQRWAPLAAYESEGYWEVSLDEVGEHFDWLTR